MMPTKVANVYLYVQTYKGSYSQAMVFPLVMYEWESWTIKKAEH